MPSQNTGMIWRCDTVLPMLIDGYQKGTDQRPPAVSWRLVFSLGRTIETNVHEDSLEPFAWHDFSMARSSNIFWTGICPKVAALRKRKPCNWHQRSRKAPQPFHAWQTECASSKKIVLSDLSWSGDQKDEKWSWSSQIETGHELLDSMKNGDLINQSPCKFLLEYFVQESKTCFNSPELPCANAIASSAATSCSIALSIWVYENCLWLSGSSVV